LDRLFNPSKAHKLEDPARLIWLPPAEVVEQLALLPGMTIADIGAGTGYFSLPIAHAIAPGGKVFAIDLQQEMLNLLANKLLRPDAPPNISLHRGDASHLPLTDASVDLTFLANIWHELDDLSSVLAELRRVLKPEGRIAILDWRADLASPPGPPQDHRIPAAQAVSFLSANGCTDVRSRGVGQFSYLVTATARYPERVP
jgi:ubiquinone/menaquinone biosynthesis C-methylase UbiE